MKQTKNFISCYNRSPHAVTYYPRLVVTSCPESFFNSYKLAHTRNSLRFMEFQVRYHFYWSQLWRNRIQSALPYPTYLRTICILSFNPSHYATDVTTLMPTVRAGNLHLVGKWSFGDNNNCCLAVGLITQRWKPTDSKTSLKLFLALSSRPFELSAATAYRI